jgi:hypothetical protein
MSHKPDQKKTHLHGKLVPCMGATIDNIESRDWQDQLLVSCQVRNVLSTLNKYTN